ncbi:hypothetical protein D3C75_852520 [compost metagenome]
MGQVSIKLPDQLRRSAFLRPEHNGCAPFAAQRIRHIAGHNQLNLPQPLIERRNINAGQPAQTAASAWKHVSRCIKEFCPERLSHPCASVIRRAAADTDNDAADTPVQAFLDQLAGAIGGGDQRIAIRLVYELYSAGRCHLNSCRQAVAQNAILSSNGLTQRSHHFLRINLPAGCIDK